MGTQGILLDQKVPLAHSPLGEREGRDRSRCLLQSLTQVDKLPRRHGISKADTSALLKTGHFILI